MASFLSLLNQVGGKNGAAGSVPKVEPAAPKIVTQGITGTKRKADTDLQKPDDKIRKLENTTSRDIKPITHRPVASSNGIAPPKATNPSTTSSSFTSSIRPKAIQSNTKAATSNSKPNGPIARSVTATKTTTRPVTSNASKAPSSKPSPGAQSAAEKPVRRLTYKEKLARAEQNKLQAAGQIVHKPTVSMKERLAQAKAQIKNKAAAKIPTKLTTNGKAGAVRDGKQKDTATPKMQFQGTAKPKPVRSESAYQGTARPSGNTQPAYSGTARPRSKPISRAPPKPAKKYERDEYLGTDEEEEDEDGYGYDDDDRYAEASDDYSDMEAGFDDISDEEREAERVAKADDLREQRELERLAAEKRARKKAGRG